MHLKQIKERFKLILNNKFNLDYVINFIIVLICKIVLSEADSIALFMALVYMFSHVVGLWLVAVVAIFFAPGTDSKEVAEKNAAFFI